MIMAPESSCLFWKVQQEVLSEHPFCRNAELICFLVRKSYNSSNDQNGVMLPRTASVRCADACLMLHNLECQHLKGQRIICTIFSSFTMLVLINSTLNDTLHSLSVFLIRILTKQHFQCEALSYQWRTLIFLTVVKSQSWAQHEDCLPTACKDDWTLL